MDPLDAVLQVQAAHPDLTHAELASVCTEYGVPVSPTQVLIAVRTRTRQAVPAVPEDAEPQQPALPAAPADEPEPVTVPDLPWSVPGSDPPWSVPVPHPIGPGYTRAGLHLDVITEPEVRPEFACAVPAAQVRNRRTWPEVHARVPDVPRGIYGGSVPLDELADGALYARRETEAAHRTRTRPEAIPAVPERSVPGVPAVQERPVPVPHPAGTGGADDVPALLVRARAVDDAHRQEHKRPASIHTLKKELGVGQPKAQLIRDLLAAE
jgi:hypothetical protein